MFIREVKKHNKGHEKEFISHRLVESYRTEKGPRQRVILDLGRLTIPRSQWKALADAIEAKVSGQRLLFAVDPEIDELAAHYAQQIVQQHLLQQPAPEKEEPPAKEYETIDTGSLQNLRSRTVGGEYVGLETCKRLGLDCLFKKLA